MVWLALAGAVSLGPVSIAYAQELTGTLKKVKDSGVITIGYRESSIPFSYLNLRHQPIGYSIDLCNEIVDDVAAEVEREVSVAYKPVTSENRISMLLSGQIDLECGSTTSNFTRQKQVAFSPIFFVAGTKLLVKKSSRIRSYRDLRGRTVVVTAGTTNEAAIRTLSDKQKLNIKIATAHDHRESFDLVISGKADAFATDDVLLYGLIATTKSGADYHVVGEYLSYDPYGLMFRKDDPDIAAVVERTFARLAESRQIVDLYNKWFQKRLPTGETLDLPISPQLEEIFRAMGVPEE
ncbi:MAG: amino acid ABC transporter substrate-binding protein [Gammaproteobacteria bacterium]|nr:amino acid ABC transporter substrate-binding protein [Gammaproteobacteria bacterium]